MSESDITVVPREVYVVDTVQKAQQAAARLRALHAANPSMFFACDTEVCCSFVFSPDWLHASTFCCAIDIAPPKHQVDLQIATHG